MNYDQIKAIEKKNKEMILSTCPDVPELSGIYIFTRYENGFKYAYVGQAKKLLTRLAQHLRGCEQHIDLSIKKHGLYSSSNKSGWMVTYKLYAEEELDQIETYQIRQYASYGYQLYNHTTGGQGEGKRSIGETKSPRGYRDGVKQGERNMIRKIKHLVEKHLEVSPRNPSNKRQQMALQKFNDYLDMDIGDGSNG